MKTLKLILLSILTILGIQNYSYSLSFINSNDAEVNKIFDKTIDIKETNNASFVPHYYYKNKEKKGIFFFNTNNLSIKLKKLYIAKNYDSPVGPFEITEVEHSLCDLFIYYQNNKASKIWESQFSCSGGSSATFFTAEFNSKSYDFALINTANTYIYPRPVCAPIDNCQNDQPVHEPEVKIVLIYDPITDNWIDSKYLADQRINYLASVNGKTSLKKFAGILKKQIKDLNIDLEDISPAAQTCYFLEPLEPCYKNLK